MKDKPDAHKTQLRLSTQVQICEVRDDLTVQRAIHEALIAAGAVMPPRQNSLLPSFLLPSSFVALLAPSLCP